MEAMETMQNLFLEISVEVMQIQDGQESPFGL